MKRIRPIKMLVYLFENPSTLQDIVNYFYGAELKSLHSQSNKKYAKADAVRKMHILNVIHRAKRMRLKSSGVFIDKENLTPSLVNEKYVLGNQNALLISWVTYDCIKCGHSKDKHFDNLAEKDVRARWNWFCEECDEYCGAKNEEGYKKYVREEKTHEKPKKE